MEDMGPLRKPSPNNSGQATKQKARWAEKKGRGELQHPKELLLSPFSQKPSQKQDQMGSVQRQPRLSTRSC